jgi:hypothetical protein
MTKLTSLQVQALAACAIATRAVQYEDKRLARAIADWFNDVGIAPTGYLSAGYAPGYYWYSPQALQQIEELGQLPELPSIVVENTQG